MLADALSAAKEEVLVQVERRAEATEGPGLPALGRRERLHALLDELVDALTHGAISDRPLSAPSTADPQLVRNERELVQQYLLERIAHAELAASTADTAIVSAWPCHVERFRQRERSRQLTALLDGVDECA